MDPIELNQEKLNALCKPHKINKLYMFDSVLSENKKISYYQLFDIEQQLQNHFNKNVELVNLKYMNPVIKLKTEKDIIYIV
jgi:hypothetical protein